MKHPIVSEAYNVGQMVPSIGDETNMFFDVPPSSIIVKVIDDFVGLFVDGITENDNARDAEPDDVCDAEAGCGY